MPQTDATGAHVVVGGASGIGAAVVDAERAAGADVVVWDIAGSYDVKCDVTDPASVDEAVAETLAAPARRPRSRSPRGSAIRACCSTCRWTSGTASSRSTPGDRCS